MPLGHTLPKVVAARFPTPLAHGRQPRRPQGLGGGPIEHAQPRQLHEQQRRAGGVRGDRVALQHQLLETLQATAGRSDVRCVGWCRTLMNNLQFSKPCALVTLLRPLPDCSLHATRHASLHHAAALASYSVEP
jgi:hypothetical protein